MAKTPEASRVDYSAKVKSQGLRLVPDPDRHIIDPSHVVEDKVAECIEHSKGVLQRQPSETSAVVFGRCRCLGYKSIAC